MPPAVEWLMIVDDGPFQSLEFTVPAAMVGPHMLVQVIKGAVKTMYRSVNIDQQAKQVHVEKM